jgi:hypothetical protein
MDANLVYAIASLGITLGLCGTATINIPIAMATAATGDPQCDNYFERKDRFADRDEDIDENPNEGHGDRGEKESFINSFKNGGPCL